jgi:hypothetical protein
VRVPFDDDSQSGEPRKRLLLVQLFAAREVPHRGDVTRLGREHVDKCGADRDISSAEVGVEVHIWKRFARGEQAFVRPSVVAEEFVSGAIHG